MSNNGGDNFLARPEPKANIQRSILILSASFQDSQATSNRNLLPTKTSNTSGIQCHSISMGGILSQMRSDLICLTSKRFAFFFISWRWSDLWGEIYWTGQCRMFISYSVQGSAKVITAIKTSPLLYADAQILLNFRRKTCPWPNEFYQNQLFLFGRWGPTLRSYCLLSANLYSTGGLDCK